MTTSRLKNIFLIAIPFFIAHEIEEWLTNFWDTDALTKFVSQYFQTISQATFVGWNAAFILSLIAIFLVLKGGKSTLFVMWALGFIFIFELNHAIKALASFSYYSGAITSIPLLIIGFFFWKELIKQWRKQ